MRLVRPACLSNIQLYKANLQPTITRLDFLQAAEPPPPPVFLSNAPSEDGNGSLSQETRAKFYKLEGSKLSLLPIKHQTFKLKVVSVGVIPH